MTLVADVMGHRPDAREYSSSNLLSSDRLIGVEVELEDCDLNRLENHKEAEQALNAWWKKDDDGSLRGKHPMEFVLDYPCSGENLINALFSLQQAMEIVEPDTNERTSLHLHIDVRDLEVKVLYRFMLVYIAVEALLYAYCDTDREANAYCVPVAQTQYLLDRIGVMFGKARNTMSNVCGDSYDIRYSGLNIHAIHKFGSVELRMHQACYTSGEIINWINIILSLVNYAKNNEFDPADFSNRVSVRGVELFVNDVFGDATNTMVYEGYQHDVMLNVRAAQDVAYYYNNNNALASLIEDVYKRGDAASLFSKFQDKEHLPKQKKGEKKKKPNKEDLWQALAVEEPNLGEL